MCLRDGQKRKRVCGSPELQGIGKSVWLKNHVEKKKKTVEALLDGLHRNQSRSEEAGVERHLTVSTAKKRRGVEGSGNRNWAHNL